MRYFKIEHAAGGFFCRCIDEQSKSVERKKVDGSWSRLPAVFSIAYWRSLGHTITEVTEADANG